MLINNAAVGLDAPIEEQSIDEGRYLFELNLFAPLHLIQLLLPTMRQQPQGQIVQISSIVGLRAVPNSALYCASKYALNGLSDALRAELQGSHIVVTSIYPGVTRTNFVTNQLRSPRIPTAQGGGATGAGGCRHRGGYPQATACTLHHVARPHPRRGNDPAARARRMAVGPALSAAAR